MTARDVDRERELAAEIAALKERLAEPVDTLSAIRQGEVDAFVVAESAGERVYVLTDAELAANEQARREADRRKDEFLAMLGHELRNPLAAISNAVHVLERLGPADAMRTGAQDVILRQVRLLSRLVDDLLDVSRIAAGKIELRREAVDLVSLAGRVAEALRPLVEERGRRLSVHLSSHPVPVHADPTRLEQILSNLLGNALKFTDEGGQISVQVSEAAGAAVLRVRDTGVGISADVLPSVFDLFTQGTPAQDPSQSGLGVGLALVKTFVELHGGTIVARSEGLGRGSEFEISLPLLHDAPASGDEGAREPRAVVTATRLRVLVVDDHVDSADALASLLTLNGHDVRSAYDGRSALAIAKEFRPDAVFLDIGMPEMDGYQAAGLLRESLGADALIVALTGYAEDADETRAAAARIDRHVLKPLDPRDIGKILGLAKPRRGE
jgi:signal transduction histidine kinase/ActR/RegA family two-component response regulator